MDNAYRGHAGCALTVPTAAVTYPSLRMVDDGLGHEHWGVQDSPARLQQLGAVPVG